MKLTHLEIARLEAFLTDFEILNSRELAKKMKMHPAGVTNFGATMRKIGIALPKKNGGITAAEYAEFRAWKAAKEASLPRAAE